MRAGSRAAPGTRRTRGGAFAAALGAAALLLTGFEGTAELHLHFGPGAPGLHAHHHLGEHSHEIATAGSGLVAPHPARAPSAPTLPGPVPAQIANPASAQPVATPSHRHHHGGRFHEHAALPIESAPRPAAAPTPAPLPEPARPPEQAAVSPTAGERGGAGDPAPDPRSPSERRKGSSSTFASAFAAIATTALPRALPALAAAPAPRPEAPRAASRARRRCDAPRGPPASSPSA